MMENNPIAFSDVLGDTLKAANKKSAERLKSEIVKTFDNNSIKALFKLQKDGLTIAPINKHEFLSAIEHSTSDEQKLAYGYFSVINNSNLHIVEMVYRSESLNTGSQAVFGNKIKTGEDLDKKVYGGVNFNLSPTINYSIIVMDNIQIVGDFVTNTKSMRYSSFSSSPGELLAHELIGHGLGSIVGSSSSGYEDAIQLTNLYLRTKGINYRFRDGSMHSKLSHQTPALSKEKANQIPLYLNLPIDFNVILDKKRPALIQRDNLNYKKIMP
jgi:hypothetical protein